MYNLAITVENVNKHALLLVFTIIISINSISQTTYQYDENGNRTARIIDLGKNLETTANFNDSLQGEPELPKPLLETLGKATVNIYPNPTKGLLILESQGFAMDALPEYEVYTLSGSLLLRVEAIENRQQIDLCNEPAGIYLLRIKSGTLQREWKIIKQ